MIRELQISSFMRERVAFLATIAADVARFLNDFGPDIVEEEDDVRPFDEHEVVEFVESLRGMAADVTLWEPATERWLPRNAYAGLLQSTLDDYYRVNDAVRASNDVYGERLVDDPLLSASRTAPPPVRTGAGRFQLNTKDPRWALVLYAKRIRRRHGDAPFTDNTGAARTLASDARMLLVGDWASGIPGAVQVAATMRRDYVLPVLGSREVHVVHLGDVYYAGLTKEYTNNFLRHWPVRPGEEAAAFSWCLPGNHDMYAGGRTFFRMLGSDARFATQNRSSYFHLDNEEWQVFGLDSAYQPVDYRGDKGVLFGEQAAWFAQRRALAPDKKCLLLTHHQPFSAYENPDDAFARRFRPIADAGQITAWFWGHEHLCAHYYPADGIEHPVLLGHGGFPQAPVARQVLKYAVRFEWTASSSEGNLYFGFAVLDFSTSGIDVRLVDQAGSVQHTFTIN